MPSASQIAGADILRAMLPNGMPGPEVTILARRDQGDGNGIAFSVWPHKHHGSGGEYRQTIVVPHFASGYRDIQLERLRILVDRWVEIETMRETCRLGYDGFDIDPQTGQARNGAPVPAWMTHCPRAFRNWCDRLDMDDEARRVLVDKNMTSGNGRAQMKVHDVSNTLTHMAGGRPLATRSLKRLTITAPGAVYTQGINKSRLTIDQLFPQTILTAVTGHPISRLVDMPGLESTGMVVLSTQTQKSGRTIFELARGHAMAATPPAIRK